MQTEAWLESFDGKLDCARNERLVGPNYLYFNDVSELIEEVRFWMDMSRRLGEALARRRADD